MDDLPETSCTNEGTDLETLDYLRGVKSSTCLLLPMTPSPTPLDFKHPLSEEMNEDQLLSLADDPKMSTMQNSDASAGDSSSSGDSNSVVQDPVSAQLINNISMLDYQTLSKNGDMIIRQPEGCKINGNITVNNRKLPNFVNWNWIVIRKILLWSGYLAMFDLSLNTSSFEHLVFGCKSPIDFVLNHRWKMLIRMSIDMGYFGIEDYSYGYLTFVTPLVCDRGSFVAKQQDPAADSKRNLRRYITVDGKRDSAVEVVAGDVM
ncbi:unnamed protein product, partial [Iphiclides podalirius]